MNLVVDYIYAPFYGKKITHFLTNKIQCQKLVKSFIFNTCPIINGLFPCVNNSVHYLTVSDC